MDVFVARQPIFDSHLKTYGYELLFRNSLDNLFPDIDGETATSAVLSNSFLCFGLEKLTGGKKAFINMTRNLLLNQFPCLFSPQLLYSEILEDIEPDKPMVDAISIMHKKGCMFALDDFVFHKKYIPLMRLADIIKIDIQQTPLEKAKKLIEKSKGIHTKFLAEKVETTAEFKEAKELGFSYFQGYFFSKPEIINKRTLPPVKMKLLQIMGELIVNVPDISRLENLVKSDVSLSYRLLQYMNSAFFNLPEKITSIKGVLVYLGLTEVKKIVTLLVTSKLAENKPSELLRTSVIRAKLCELTGQLNDYKGDLSELFLLGLFSLMDTILEVEMDEIISKLPVSDNLKKALVKKTGPLSDYLKMAECFEKGDWDDESLNSGNYKKININIESYMEAIAWADAFNI